MDEFKRNAHLFLGLTRKEFDRRLRAGLIDCELLKSQMEQNALELELESKCEKLLATKAVDQLDKYQSMTDAEL